VVIITSDTQSELDLRNRFFESAKDGWQQTNSFPKYHDIPMSANFASQSSLLHPLRVNNQTTGLDSSYDKSGFGQTRGLMQSRSQPKISVNDQQ
jgi:hypothetical protein